MQTKPVQTIQMSRTRCIAVMQFNKYSLRVVGSDLQAMHQRQQRVCDFEFNDFSVLRQSLLKIEHSSKCNATLTTIQCQWVKLAPFSSFIPLEVHELYTGSRVPMLYMPSYLNGSFELKESKNEQLHETDQDRMISSFVVISVFELLFQR